LLKAPGFSIEINRGAQARFPVWPGWPPATPDLAFAAFAGGTTSIAHIWPIARRDASVFLALDLSGTRDFMAPVVQG